MECLGPQCASMVLEWLKARAVGAAAEAPAAQAVAPVSEGVAA